MNFLREIKFAIRYLAGKPGVSLVAILTLALGIGANITMFSATSAFLLRLMPVPDASRLFRLQADADGVDIFSYPWFLDFQRRSKAASAMAAFSFASINFNAASGNPQTAKGQLVSGDFFSILGIRPQLGRSITPNDNLAEGASPVVVLSDGFWKRQFGGASKVIGRKIFLNGYPFTIVGVMPKAFLGSDAVEIPDLWTPLMMYTQIRPRGLSIMKRNWGWLNGIGKLNPGIKLQQAQAEFDQITAEVNREHPESASKFRLTPAHAVPETWTEGLAKPLKLLTIVVLLLLLVVSANVASVLLANVIAARHEIAIRKSLGATTFRISMSWLARCAVLCFAGGAAGLVVALWGRSLLRLLIPPQWSSLVSILNHDSTVVGFTLLICALASLVCGVIPIAKLNRIEALSTIKEGKFGASSRLFGGLIIGQVCLSFLLLLLSGLFLRSLQNSSSFQLGFRKDNLVLADIDLRRNGYPEEKARAYYDNLLQTIRAMQDVESADLALVIPLSGNEEELGYRIQGFRNTDGTNQIGISNNFVTPRYFKNMRISILRGREFREEDSANSKQVIVINETMAKKFWNTSDVVGKVIKDGGSGADLEIIGVAADSKYYSLGEDPMPYLYRSFHQNFSQWMTLQIRTRTDAARMISTLQALSARIDSNVAFSNVTTFSELRKIQLFPLRALSFLCTFFGALAVLLTMLGIYGVISYSVQQRFREIGIRMALGAHGYDVLRIFLTRAFRFTAIGILAGLCLAFWFARFVRGLLFHVSAVDPFSFGIVGFLLIVAGMISCYLPARSAVRANVMEALRYE